MPFDIKDDQVLALIKALTFKECNTFSLNKDLWMDFYQDIISILIEAKYIERYNDKKGVTFAAYLYTPVHNFIMKKRRRADHEKNLFTSLEKSSDDGDEFSLSSVIPDSTPETDSSLPEDVEFLYEQLKKDYPFSSSVIYSGRIFLFANTIRNVDDFLTEEGYLVFPRSVAHIFWLLSKGYSQAEIASFLHVSRPWLSKCVVKIRTHPDILAWAEKLNLDIKE